MLTFTWGHAAGRSGLLGGLAGALRLPGRQAAGPMGPWQCPAVRHFTFIAAGFSVYCPWRRPGSLHRSCGELGACLSTELREAPKFPRNPRPGLALLSAQNLVSGWRSCWMWRVPRHPCRPGLHEQREPCQRAGATGSLGQGADGAGEGEGEIGEGLTAKAGAWGLYPISTRETSSCCSAM